MSKVRDIGEANTIVTVDGRSKFDRISGALFGMSFYAFCFYFSQGSYFWTFVSGLLLLARFAFVLNQTLDKSKSFEKNKDAIKYLEGLSE